jgi:hypothetical protein
VIRVLSLGGGVQSVTVARMSLDGELPPLDHVVFADTGAEWPQTYETVAALEAACHNRGIGFHRVTCHYERSSGSLYEDLMGEGAGARWAAPPLFISDEHGRGMTMRQCTGDYKKDPIQRKVRELAGIKPRSPGPAEPVIEVWLGISADEVQRMKAPTFRWERVWHPLIEGPRRMRRHDCVRWLQQRGYPVPVKSACFFCPYQSDRRWRELRDREPDLWRQAVALDEQTRRLGQFKGTAYYHRSCVPLAEVDLRTPEERGQLAMFDEDGFGDECSGTCGL